MDLRPALEQTLRNYKLNAQDKNVNLEMDLEETLPTILGNWDLILQVLDNLVGNGLKFSSKGGKLKLSAYTWPDICRTSPIKDIHSAPHCELVSPLPRLRIEIADNGCGITDADQQRIFERFYRVENSVHTEVGTGLGLSIVKGIIEKHGSRIFMASEPNIGTTFWFDLPLEQADADELRLQAERREDDRIWNSLTSKLEINN
tara:strand:- start:21 stop:629 length:609 start_codon:yes stop_codon:yes gene_type:complete